MGRHTETESRRYIAVLREDKRNYAITATRRPRGKAVIEISGNNGLLKCKVKNLVPPRKLGGNTIYGVWLLSEDSGVPASVQAGTIKISEEGLGESSWAFDVNSLRSAGLDVDSSILLEVRASTTNKRTPVDRVLMGQLELEEVNLPEEPKMEKVTPFGVGMPYSQWWKFYPGFLNDWMYNPSNPGSTPAQRPTSQAKDLKSCLEEVSAFQTGPVFQGHQLVGLQYDEKGAVKYLVHGIPGRFCLRDQPYGGATGYLYWHPLPGQQYRAGEYGYWLIQVDPKTGEVVFPQKATSPPDCDHCDKIDK